MTLAETFDIFLKNAVMMFLIGGVLAVSGQLVMWVWERIKRKMTTEIVIENEPRRKEVFSWIEYKIGKSAPSVGRSSTRLQAVLKRHLFPHFGNFMESATEEPEISWVQQLGTSVRLTFEGRSIWIERNKAKESSVTEGYINQLVISGFVIRCVGANVAFLERFLESVRQEYYQEMRKKTNVWSLNKHAWGQGGVLEWNRLAARPSRHLETVVLEKGMVDRIVQDAKEFIDLEDWYSERGIPYRRGYLFHGPPGVGKSSFVSALAGHLGLLICVLDVSNPGLNDAMLMTLLSQIPKHSIILLEDIDSAFNKPVTPTHPHEQRVTLAGLLNALDGVAAQEGKLCIMTTNYPENLEPSLTRPGRIDLKAEFKLADRNMAMDFFARFYQLKRLDEDVIAFGKVQPEGGVSMADIQAHLMNHRRKPKEAINTFRVSSAAASSSNK